MLNREVSYLSNNYESGSKWKSVLGEISRQDDIDGQQGDIDSYGMYLNGKEMYVASPSESARIRITVINRDLGTVVDVHTF